MKHVNTDLSVNLPWKISRGTHNACTLVFSSSMDAYSNWRLNVKLKEGHPSSVLSLTEGAGITVDDATHIKIEFIKEQSLSLKKKEPYYYELIYNDENGDTFALFRSDQFSVQNQNQSQPTGTVAVSVNTSENSLTVHVVVGSGGGGPDLAAEIAARTEADEELQDAIDSHTQNTSNPHTVTKTQVGLGNVDNTSDTSKPVSTAQQTALDGKWNVAGATSIPSDATVSVASGSLEINHSSGSNRRLLLSNTNAQLQFGGDNVLQFTAATAVFRSSVGGANSKGIDITAASISVQDSHSLAGMRYAGNYTTNGLAIGDRWIPDYGAVKSYADARATNATFVSALIAGLTTQQKQDLVAALIDEIRATINEE